MTTHSRTLLTIAAAALVIGTTVTTGLSAGAQPPAGRGPGQGPGRGGPGGPLPVLRQLDLTDTQRQEIKALMTAERASRTQAQTQTPARTLVDLRRSLHAAIFAETPDTAHIDTLRASIAEAEAAVLAARVDLEMKVAQILTPEQRARARELTARAPGRGPRARGNRGVWPHATQP